jgi:hypothetical protein
LALRDGLKLTPDDVRALLDSMESNDHCTRAYHGVIVELRDKIAGFAGRGGLTLLRDAEPRCESGLGWPEAEG